MQMHQLKSIDGSSSSQANDAISPRIQYMNQVQDNTTSTSLQNHKEPL